MHQPHPFDAAIRLEPQGEGRWRGHTHEAYGNMVGPFGGATAAAVLAAVLAHPARQGEPIALTVNFAGPVAQGPFDIDTTAARTNRSTQHWSVQMRQGADVVATATAVLALRRETWSAVEAGFPDAPPSETIVRTPPLDRVRWTSAYDMRFVQGPLQMANPLAGERDSVSLLWVRDEPPRALDFCSLAALCDVFFPRLFVKRPSWVPVGTVSYTVYFHADATTLAAMGTRHPGARARPAVSQRPIRPIRRTVGSRRRVARGDTPDRLLQGVGGDWRLRLFGDIRCPMPATGGRRYQTDSGIRCSSPVSCNP